jgi:hypothetical protein
LDVREWFAHDQLIEVAKAQDLNIIIYIDGDVQ